MARSEWVKMGGSAYEPTWGDSLDSTEDRVQQMSREVDDKRRLHDQGIAHQ